MRLKIRKQGKKTVLEGDSQFFAWLTTAANSAANGFQGNVTAEGDLELVTTEPADKQPSPRKTALRPTAPKRSK